MKHCIVKDFSLDYQYLLVICEENLNFTSYKIKLLLSFFENKYYNKYFINLFF